MRAPARFLLASLLLILLAGCATVSRDVIVLLPKADGSTGAIAATRAGEEVLLDSAYASARTGVSGKLRTGTENAEKVKTEFAAALAGMPPAPASYTVYFLSGGDEFTEESKSVLATMLEQTRVRPFPEITVIGHTDRVGSDADNDVLSLQRAEKVREMLVAMGVAKDSIRAVGRGWREPLVPTERGVDEPRNRRVEVSVR